MAYSDQALLSNDADFRDRIAASAVVELDLQGQHPQSWAVDNQWQLAASPGFAQKYASALAAGINRPGNDESVISDADILSAIQALEAARTDA